MKTVKEIADFLRVSVPAVRKWQKKGLPFLKAGRCTRFDQAEVLAWLKAQQEKRRNGGGLGMTKLAEALARAGEGWAVHPLFGIVNGHCECGKGSECHTPGKHPRLTGWQEKATTDPAQIRRWWRRWPHATIGVVTGALAGFVVLAVDPDKGGEKE
jgi:excisionase family DNA binding protein